MLVVCNASSITCIECLRSCRYIMYWFYMLTINLHRCCVYRVPAEAEWPSGILEMSVWASSTNMTCAYTTYGGTYNMDYYVLRFSPHNFYIHSSPTPFSVFIPNPCLYFLTEQIMSPAPICFHAILTGFYSFKHSPSLYSPLWKWNCKPKGCSTSFNFFQWDEKIRDYWVLNGLCFYCCHQSFLIISSKS